MSDVFVDTSAFYPLLLEEDDNHDDARMAAGDPDWASILLMQDHRIEQAFAFDEDFTRMGIDLIPTGST